MKRNLRKILGIFAGLLIVLGLRKVHSLASFDSSKASCPDVILWSSSESSKETKILVLPELEYPLKWEQKGGSIDDASCLNRTIIAGIVQIESQEDVLNALSFASKHNLKVSIAGQQHTMGGHTF
ncbi:MAG: hypothetical protein OEY44_03860, partial [Candidatus Peregrinibacteria bacterium]|nr:hypothetical protein [Candidatus Peregrinibacteria bacterium]